MKFLLFCCLVGIAYGEVITTVTVSKEAINYNAGSTAVLPCAFTMEPEQTQPPIIYWMKGVSVDDADAEVIFKGFRYWNESLGEYRQFFGDYEKRSTVEDLDVPTIKIADLTSADEGRYWCMVAEWSGRQQEGTDADSVAVTIGGTKPYVYATTPTKASIEMGGSVTINCDGHKNFDVVSWYEGPFHRSDQENFTHTEIGQYDKIGTYNMYGSLGLVMESDNSRLTIDAGGNLKLTNANLDDAGRYWCEASYHKATNEELETDRSSVQLEVTGYTFDCADHTTGLYPDPTDCSMYYECVNGDATTYHRSCGYDGLVFDEANQYCDWAANVPPPCGTNNDNN